MSTTDNRQTGGGAIDNPAEYELDPAVGTRLKLNDDGLLPAVVQAADTGEVLMLAWMDTHALAYTLATRRGTYFSRSRQEYWIKGLTSGNTQHVESVALDCDGDTVLLRVRQRGGACHTGDRTCFDADVLLA
ncbi:phosphoribosyl-AMP cyclohydrolase [Corynebacterium propinquum]